MNQNVVDAALLNTKRIGHGFNLALNPAVQQMVIEKDICLEVCPLSNQLLQYIPDIRNHFASVLFRQGVPMVLSSDDPVMFGTVGLTYDFYAAVVSWQLDLLSIKRLVFNSIIYSSLNDAEKEKSLKNLQLSWDNWTQQALPRPSGITLKYDFGPGLSVFPFFSSFKQGQPKSIFETNRDNYMKITVSNDVLDYPYKNISIVLENIRKYGSTDEFFDATLKIYYAEGVGAVQLKYTFVSKFSFVNNGFYFQLNNLASQVFCYKTI